MGAGKDAGLLQVSRECVERNESGSHEMFFFGKDATADNCDAD